MTELWPDGSAPLADFEIREYDLTVLDVGPNRLQVARVLRRAGWSLQGVGDVLSGLANWIRATGLTSAHQLAAVGAVLEVETRVYLVPRSGNASQLVSDTSRRMGPGYTVSRRDQVAGWARQHMDNGGTTIYATGCAPCDGGLR
jgi:hypothetical protein